MMSRQSLWVLALAFVCAGPTSAATLDCERHGGVPQSEQPQQAPAPAPRNAHDQRGRWMWWRVPETKAELGITDSQASEIDQIFQANVPALREAKDALDKLDAEVAQTIKAATADVAAVNQLVGRAEQARAKLTTTRTVMFYRMHRVLSPEQRVKLNAMFERWEAERRKTTGSTRR
jgi:Spy/CpxP family protein refolding chaperone